MLLSLFLIPEAPPSAETPNLALTCDARPSNERLWQNASASLKQRTGAYFYPLTPEFGTYERRNPQAQASCGTIPLDYCERAITTSY